MSYRVEITSYFKKQAKHLLKKYPSLKSELENMVDILEKDPFREFQLEIIVTKSGYLLLQKTKENQVVQD